MLLPAAVQAADLSFTPRARLQLDAASAAPDDRTGSTGADVRRFRLGGEGDLPADIRWRLDVEFSSGEPVLQDAWVRRTFGPATVTMGHQRTLNGLDQVTSSVNSFLLERASFNDAFGNPRRLGMAIATRLGGAPARIDVGVFGPADSQAAGDDALTLAGRAVAWPSLGDVQVHLAVNAQSRTYRTDARSVAPSVRPYSQVLEPRFVRAPRVAASGESLLGAEAAARFGRTWVAGEAQRLAVRGPGAPVYWGGYAEAGFFVTGEQRAYGEGAWGRTRSNGRWGSVALVARLDHLDLGAGGRQTGLLGSVTWAPGPLRFIAEVGRAGVQDGPTPGAFTFVGVRAQASY